MMGRACRPSRIPRPFPLLGPVSLFQLSVSSGCVHLLVLSSTSRESRYVFRVSSADSSYRPLYLRVNTNSQRGRRWEERAGRHTSARTTTPRKKGEARAVAHSPSTYTLLYAGVYQRARCTFPSSDGRAAVADKLPHYAYAAYAPPKRG